MVLRGEFSAAEHNVFSVLTVGEAVSTQKCAQEEVYLLIPTPRVDTMLPRQQ
jgi:hypothetical protein